MNELYNVSASPHVRSKTTTKSIMRDVAVALIPACLAGIINFGYQAFLIIVVTVATCVLTEYLFQKLMHKKITTSDFSALVTGILLALNLPASVPLWIPIIGGVFAILIVKQLYGGLGQNFMNPALAARCFLLICFMGRMTTFTYDGVTGPTPLALLKEGKNTASVTNMFLGNIAGTIGETSALAILIGAAFLIYRKVISVKIPFCYILSFLLFLLLFSGKGFDVTYLAMHLFGGGLLLGAFFMATDYVTSPITEAGKIVYGVMLGVLTGIFRVFGKSAEGVSYAIIFCNLLVPLIEKITIPSYFGQKQPKRSAEENGKSKIVGNALKLFVISLVAATLLGFIYEVTLNPIQEQNEKNKQKAYQIVLADAAVFKESDQVAQAVEKADEILIKAADAMEYKGITIEEAVEAFNQEEQLIGYVLNITTANGYGGDISISLGIKLDGTVTGVEILSINETAGLGMKATEPKFKNQFKDKKVEKFTYTKSGAKSEQQIDALTGATITTRAITNAVNAGVYFASHALLQ